MACRAPLSDVWQMNIDRETAYAKINLALHVRRRRADGYHDLESLFVFAAEGDLLTLDGDGDWSLALEGPFAGALSAGTDNLVLRAGRLLAERFGISQGAQLRLVKNLPVASGIGGGSADAAAALRLLSRRWGILADDPWLAEIAAELGADVPACLASVPLRGEGVGTSLTTIEGGAFGGLPLLLVNPGIALGTSHVFARWDGIDHGALCTGDPLAVALAGRNDLTSAAVDLVPEISDILVLLETLSGLILARMSGSGATCFALFDSTAARDVGAAMISLAMPTAWLLATELR